MERTTENIISSGAVVCGALVVHKGLSETCPAMSETTKAGLALVGGIVTGAAVKAGLASFRKPEPAPTNQGLAKAIIQETISDMKNILEQLKAAGIEAPTP